MHHQLAVNIGNTHIDFGIFADHAVIFSHTVKTSHEDLEENFEKQFLAHLQSHSIDPSSITQSIMGSVVPEITSVIGKVLARILHYTPMVATTALQLNVNIRPVNKKEIGIDLVANAVAARTHNPQSSSIIIDIGTAISITAVDGQGTLCGVAIAPGIHHALQSVINNAALISATDLMLPDHYLATNTTEAIGVGVGLGLCGLIGAIVAGMQNELDGPSKVFLTGGGASVIQPALVGVDYHIPTLTLQGYRAILVLNSPHD